MTCRTHLTGAFGIEDLAAFAGVAFAEERSTEAMSLAASPRDLLIDEYIMAGQG